MYEAVMEHQEEDEEEPPDQMVSRLTRQIHDQKCLGMLSPVLNHNKKQAAFQNVDPNATFM